ncbi:unnamed protein product [Coregonus sp. 'balchen']|nr:unnamed protein product [Coregonus sp. 'balchen']
MDQHKHRDTVPTGTERIEKQLNLVQPTLDVNSAHPNLYLSDGNTVAKTMSEPNNYPDHPDRFDHWQQVRGTLFISKTFYPQQYMWRAEFDQTTLVGSGVMTRCVRRVCQEVTTTGRCTREERRPTSPSPTRASTAKATATNAAWSLYCSEDKHSFVHKNQSTDIAKPRTSRGGVYVDQINGALAFYSVSVA